jgi:hypothetical protein
MEQEPIQPETATAAIKSEDITPLGVFVALGKLPANTPITEDGVAGLLGKKCRDSIKRAVKRGELPRPTKLMGKSVWTAGVIIRHIEASLESEARKIAKLRP